jgi:hypothetical protein
MSKVEIFRFAASGLLAIVGAALALASAQLWRGAPASWPDLIATDSTVRTTAKAILIVAVFLLVAAAALALNLG